MKMVISSSAKSVRQLAEIVEIVYNHLHIERFHSSTVYSSYSSMYDSNELIKRYF